MLGFADREIVDTVRDALLVLDRDLTVAFANRSFYRAFGAAPQETEGRKLYELGHGQWDVPALCDLLETVIPRHAPVEAFEIEHDFPDIGRQVMLLNARKIVRPGNHAAFFLLAIDDITERRAMEIEREELHARVAQAAQEATHRVKNSLQILQSLASLQSRSAGGEETKAALAEITRRIGAIARLYEALSHQSAGERLPVIPYLERLCADLRLSVVSGERLTLAADDDGLLLDADRHVALGLAVNGLVANAVKHAFEGRNEGRIAIRVSGAEGQMLLTVEDDGTGIAPDQRTGSGLGQTFLKSFVVRLQGTMAVESAASGTSVTIRLPIVPDQPRA
jgi:chemotaxis protein methyltransferase CheR